jgi:hypothetical protein
MTCDPDMIEIGPHQYLNRRAAERLGYLRPAPEQASAEALGERRVERKSTPPLTQHGAATPGNPKGRPAGNVAKPQGVSAQAGRDVHPRAPQPTPDPDAPLGRAARTLAEVDRDAPPPFTDAELRFVRQLAAAGNDIGEIVAITGIDAESVRMALGRRA